VQPACRHIDLWTAGPSVTNRPRKLLLPLLPSSVPTGCRVCARAHLYAHAQHIVGDLEELRSLKPTMRWLASGAMQQPAYGLLRIHLPRTPLNRGLP
jgi:hypothetical protein